MNNVRRAFFIAHFLSYPYYPTVFPAAKSAFIMHLKLLVIRTRDMQTLVSFYSLLGLSFEYHKHGASPYHYSTTIGQTVLEVYPLAKHQSEADVTLRLGFGIDDFEATLQALQNTGAVFSVQPTQTDFGFLTVVTDPDGRKVELYKN